MSGIAVRMRPRDTREEHRASSPLELVFDLTFVAAISIASSGFAHQVEEGMPGPALGPFLIAFFAIWWAWMNFTWFASAYDTDDVPYRLLTVVQMAGVLVLAAGLADAYTTANVDDGIVTLGYVVMRLALVAQWLRAALSHPGTRAVCLRYAGGITVLQLGWVLRLLLPETWMVLTSSILLAALELCVPIWAERKGRTSWNAGHIAERYGLFVIILLGEGVLGATNAVQSAIATTKVGLTPQLVAIGVLGLLVVVGLWWFYFLLPTEHGLRHHRPLAWIWGYGHYVPLGSLALVGSGLELAVFSAEHSGRGVAPVEAVGAIAWPAALFVLSVVLLHTPLLGRDRMPWAAIVAAVVLLGAAPLLGVVGLTPGMGGVVVVLAGLIAVLVRRGASAIPPLSDPRGSASAGS